MIKIDWTLSLIQKTILIFILVLLLLLFASTFPSAAMLLIITFLGSMLVVIQAIIALKDKT